MKSQRLKEELLSKRFRKRLSGFVARKIGNKSDVEEIVQDVLLSAWDSLPRFEGRSSLFTFVGAIARHEIADFYRKKKIKEIVFSRFPFLERLVSEALGPELAYKELETKGKILKVLREINEGYSLVLRLKYIEGWSVKKIAGELKITAKAVESRLTRARLAFQKEYGESEYKTEKEFFEESLKGWSFTSD